MAEGKQHQDLNYGVNTHYKPDVTKVICELDGLKPKKSLFSGKKPAKEAENATVTLAITQSGDMGTIVMKSGKVVTASYEVKIDPDKVGHKWKNEPESYYGIEKDSVVLYLKRDQ